MSREEHEPALINTFVVARKRPRLLEMLADPKHRRKALATLDHFLASIETRFMEPMAGSESKPESIAKLLRRYGAPDHCWVISVNEAIDNRLWPLDEVLPKIVGQSSGTLVSCVPGALAYHESEEPGERYILRRNGR